MFHDNQLDLLIGYYGTDYLGLAEAAKKGIARGDFNTIWSRLLARRLIRKAMKEHWLAQWNTPQGLAHRQTLAAEHSARAAYIAVGVSVFALVISVLAYIKPSTSAESRGSQIADPDQRNFALVDFLDTKAQKSAHDDGA